MAFNFAKEQPINARQYASIRQQIVRFVSLFTKRTAAAKSALLKVHEFGWSNKTRDIPQHRYRNALMAISMLRSNAKYTALCITTSDSEFDRMGLIKKDREQKKRQTMDEICDALIANGDMEAPEVLVARMREQEEYSPVEMWNFCRYRWRHICACWDEDDNYPGEQGFEQRAEREWKKMFGETETAPARERHLKLVYSAD